MKTMYARVVISPMGDLPRLIEAFHYSTRMRAAGVPDKVRRKILRARWGTAFGYAMRKEMEGLVRDLRSRL